MNKIDGEGAELPSRADSAIRSRVGSETGSRSVTFPGPNPARVTAFWTTILVVYVAASGALKYCSAPL
jgi:hypothetical protein